MFVRKFFVIAALLALAACTPGGQSASFTPPTVQSVHAQALFGINSGAKGHLLIRP
jgi:uncharacterized lipoprotein YajG